MRFTDIFVKRPVLALVINALVLLIGLRALYGLPVRQYPALSTTVITVSTSYPGATAELMQGFITQPLQQAVATAEGVDYITSSSTLGQSTITANIRLNYDPNAAMTDVMAKVQQVRYLMPEGANDPVITKSTGSETAVLYIGFSSPDLSLSAISDYLTRVVQPLLVTVEGVSAADVVGAQSFAMRVWLDPARMAGLDVTAAEVAAALKANNYQTAPGQQKGYFTATNLSANTDLSDVEGFENLVVRAKDGALVRLRDVADVQLGPQSSDQIVAINGLNAVFVAIQVTPTANPLTTVQGVKDRLPALSRTLPPGVKMDVVYDATLFISASIEDVVKTLAEAALVVVVVIFLFLGSLRAVLIPLVTIPLSLIGVGVFMVMFGFSINLLTLLAMVLAIGLVVDDAIVVVENVVRHIEEGKTPLQAALIGAREIAGPVIVMTITLAAVYAPIGFMGGLTGSLFREFALTLAGSVVISGFVALTLSPMMCAGILSRSMLEGRFAQAVNRTLTRVEAGYERWLGGSLKERPVTLVFAMGVLLALGFMYVNTTSELAPQEDQGIVFGVVKGPPYANIDYMDAYRKAIDEALVLDETNTRFIIIGQPTVNQGFVGDVLKPWDERKRTVDVIQPELQGRLGGIPGLQIFMFSPPALPGSTGGLPVQMAVYSTSGYPVVYQVMEKVKKAARDSGMFVVVDSDLAFDTAVLSIDIDRSKANELGVTMQSVGDTLALLLGGNYVNRFNLEGRSYQVIPQTPRGARLNPEDILQFYVRTASGKQIPLSTIAKVHRTTDPNALSQYNQLNSATFQAVPAPGVSMGDAVAFLNGVADKELPAGFSSTYLGDSRQYVQEGNRLAYTFGFALIVIFLVLAAQFESLRDPFVILISVPMAISGAMVPLFLGVATLNIYSQVGLVTLIGLISKHGILMVSFANELQAAEGLDRVAAIRKAARIRLRPILMTTAAMVVGLIPMVLATGAGAGSRFAIGIVIVFGLLVGTLFTLFVLPAVYTLLAADHRTAASAERDKEIAAVSRERRLRLSAAVRIGFSLPRSRNLEAHPPLPVHLGRSGWSMQNAVDDGADWRTELERGADEAPCRVDILRARQPGRGRDATTPVDIPPEGWKDVVWRMVLAFSSNRIIAMSGGVAFFALLAIFPAIATVVSLYGLFANAQIVLEHLDLLSGILPAGILQMVRDQVLLVAGKSNNSLGLAFLTGFGIALWSANSGVSALFDALNVIYGEKEKRSFVKFYATTLVVTFGAVVFVVLALAAVVFLPIVLSFMGLNTPAEKILMVARWPVLLVFVAAALSTIYRLGPSRREAKWHWVTLGSAAAALLWVGASMLFSWYVTAFDSYNRIYGSLGAAVGFMTWTWISAMIVLLGALLNAELEHQTAHDTTDGPPKPLGHRGATMADHVGAAADEL